MNTDRSSPELVTALPTCSHHEAVLACGEYRIEFLAANGDSAEQRGELVIVIVVITRLHIDVPQHLALVRIESNQAVGIVVHATAAFATWELLGARERTSVADTHVEDAGFNIDGRRIPKAATAVDAEVAPEILFYGVPVPALDTGFHFEAVHNAIGAATVNALGVSARFCRYDHIAIVNCRRHGDTNGAVIGKSILPDQLTSFGIKRKDFCSIASYAHKNAVAYCYTVRTVGRDILLVRPDNFTGFAAEALYRGRVIDDVDAITLHHRIRCNGTKWGARHELIFPSNTQFGYVGGFNRGADSVTGGRVVVLCHWPVVGELLDFGGNCRQYAGNWRRRGCCILRENRLANRHHPCGSENRRCTGTNRLATIRFVVQQIRHLLLSSFETHLRVSLHVRA